MKFLLFNAVVIGALVYLFSDDPSQLSDPKTVSAQTQKIVENAKRTVKASARVVKEKVNNFAEADQPAMPDPKPKPVVEQEAPRLPPAQPIEPWVVNPVPVVTAAKARRTPSVFKAPAPEVEVAEQPKFMTPQQRRRELNKLAHEMELMFADKLAN